MVRVWKLPSLVLDIATVAPETVHRLRYLTACMLIGMFLLRVGEVFPQQLMALGSPILSAHGRRTTLLCQTPTLSRCIVACSASTTELHAFYSRQILSKQNQMTQLVEAGRGGFGGRIKRAQAVVLIGKLSLRRDDILQITTGTYGCVCCHVGLIQQTHAITRESARHLVFKAIIRHTGPHMDPHEPALANTSILRHAPPAPPPTPLFMFLAAAEAGAAEQPSAV